MATGMQHQKMLIDAGQWLLYRFHPERRTRGANALQLDSCGLKRPVADFLERRANADDATSVEEMRLRHGTSQLATPPSCLRCVTAAGTRAPLIRTSTCG